MWKYIKKIFAFFGYQETPILVTTPLNLQPVMQPLIQPLVNTQFNIPRLVMPPVDLLKNMLGAFLAQCTDAKPSTSLTRLPHDKILKEMSDRMTPNESFSFQSQPHVQGGDFMMYI